ncbi:MAG: hypothetical protein MSS60_04960 [Clostridiales bacterium]|nr:hypothetical protein [Clostridiales bacterium]
MAAATTTVKTDEEKKQEEQLQQATRTVQSVMGNNAYTPSSAVTQAQEQLKAYQDQKPPEYTNRWKDQMDTMLNNILNRKDFQYDVKADPLFQQYRDQYIRNGQLAMRDTMGQAAQLTGGYGNSYAQQAGQQAYNGYMQGLTDKIPELYNLAMQAYNNKTNDMTNRYNLMGTQEGKEYSRYQDGLNAYNAELERLQNLYNTERSYDYGQYRDSITDAQQRWANAWAMFQAGKDTPEIRSILGLPAAAPAASSGGGHGGGDDGGGSSGTKKNSRKTSVFEKVVSNVQSGNNAAATKAVASAGKSITKTEKEQMLRYIQGNSRRT